MRAEEILFALLRYSICGHPLDVSIAELCTDKMLSAVYAIAQKHDIAHLAAHGLECLDLPHSEILAKFQNAKTQAIFRYMRQDYEYGRICDVLEHEEIPYIPLKGAVLRAYYPEPWMRTSCDIDILVHEKDLDRAVDVLINKLAMSTDRKKAYHDVSLFSPNGIHLELHFSIKENMENIDRLLSRAWEFASPVTEYGFALQKEFLVFHLIAHMSYHFAGGGCGIRPFLDVFLLRQNRMYEEAMMCTYLSTCNLEKFYDSILSLIDVWFTGKVHSAITNDMQVYLLSGGIYGSEEQRIAVQQERKGGRIGYLLDRVFMSHENLKIRYRILEKYPVLYPIMQVRRWVETLFSDRFKHSIKEMKINQQITKKQSEKINLLLRELGL